MHTLMTLTADFSVYIIKKLRKRSRDLRKKTRFECFPRGRSETPCNWSALGFFKFQKGHYISRPCYDVLSASLLCIQCRVLYVVVHTFRSIREGGQDIRESLGIAIVRRAVNECERYRVGASNGFYSVGNSFAFRTSVFRRHADPRLWPPFTGRRKT